MIRSSIGCVFVAALGLAGCAAQHGMSISGGECKVIERPPYAVRGARPYDQDWIDSTIEGGVGACNWPRPAPRPAEIDAKVGLKQAPAPRPLKRGLVSRIKAKVWPRATVAPVTAAPEPVAPPPAPIEAAPVEATPRAPAPDPEPVRRSPLEDLLHLRPGE